MKTIKGAFILNVTLFVCEIFSLGWMVSGLSAGLFAAGGWGMLRYFTVDSNILMGISALVSIVEDARVMGGHKDNVSLFSRVFKLAATASVTLTMLVTALFLAPSAIRTTGYFSLFYNSNLFLHLINPMLSIVVFVGFERSGRIPFRHTLMGIAPMLAYAVYYVAVALTHTAGGYVMRGYDWYGFFALGVKSGAVVLPVMVGITYAISAALWRLNRIGCGRVKT